MSSWESNWDLSTIPDDLLKSERGRRNAARRQVMPKGGSKPTLVTCLGCRQCTTLTKYNREHLHKCYFKHQLPEETRNYIQNIAKDIILKYSAT